MNPVRQEVNQYLTSKPKLSYIKINPDRIQSYANSLTEQKIILTNWGYEPYLCSDEQVFNFCTVLNSLNFCFWDNDCGTISRYLNPYNDGMVGSAAMVSAVKKNLDRLQPSLLDSLTMDDMIEIFGNIPMIKERKDILHEVGKVYNGNGYSDFKEFFSKNDKAFDNGEGLVEILVKELPSFDDKTKNIHFYKRAQLQVAMLYERLGKDKFDVKDIDELTAFADYQVPKALRNLGILKYAKSLSEKVDTAQCIAKDSVMELEIRACSIKACDLIVKALHEIGRNDISCLHIDNVLWKSGRQDPSNYHLTRTTAY